MIRARPCSCAGSVGLARGDSQACRVAVIWCSPTRLLLCCCVHCYRSRGPRSRHSCSAPVKSSLPSPSLTPATATHATCEAVCGMRRSHCSAASRRTSTSTFLNSPSSYAPTPTASMTWQSKRLRGCSDRYRCRCRRVKQSRAGWPCRSVSLRSYPWPSLLGCCEGSWDLALAPGIWRLCESCAAARLAENGSTCQAVAAWSAIATACLSRRICLRQRPFPGQPFRQKMLAKQHKSSTAARTMLRLTGTLAVQ